MFIPANAVAFECFDLGLINVSLRDQLGFAAKAGGARRDFRQWLYVWSRFNPLGESILFRSILYSKRCSG